jgi:hypothetical protein
MGNTLLKLGWTYVFKLKDDVHIAVKVIEFLNNNFISVFKYHQDCQGIGFLLNIEQDDFNRKTKTPNPKVFINLNHVIEIRETKETASEVYFIATRFTFCGLSP